MLVQADMTMAGSVSGGCVEGAVIKAALPLLENGHGNVMYTGDFLTILRSFHRKQSFLMWFLPMIKLLSVVHKLTKLWYLIRQT